MHPGRHRSPCEPHVAELRQHCDTTAPTSRRGSPNLIPMSTFSRRAVLTAGVVTGTGALAACGTTGSVRTPSATTAPSPTAASTAVPSSSAPATPSAPAVPVVPGYDVGVFPEIPLFELPDISLLDDSLSPFTSTVRTAIPATPGIAVHPAGCGERTERTDGSRSMLLYGDGSGTVTSSEGTVTNYGDGSGTFTIDGVEVTVYGDGSGSYENGDVSIRNYGDGSGMIRIGDVTTSVYGDGSASRSGGGIDHSNYGDGSGVCTDTAAGVSITNYGDGSGAYTDSARGLQISNYGDGTGVVNGTRVEAEALPPIPTVGSFPPMQALAPMESCGTTITLQDGVLFDFGLDTIRPDAAGVLDSLAAALTQLAVPAAEIGGHTDAIGSDEFNQDLSERRAASVVAALQQRGVGAALTPVGYGESVPVAPNDLGGVDNPAGRQQNRRVEIFVPTF